MSTGDAVAHLRAGGFSDWAEDDEAADEQDAAALTCWRTLRAKHLGILPTTPLAAETRARTSFWTSASPITLLPSRYGRRFTGLHRHSRAVSSISACLPGRTTMQPRICTKRHILIARYHSVPFLAGLRTLRAAHTWLPTFTLTVCGTRTTYAPAEARILLHVPSR